jgi:hypothetical protein
MHHFVDFDHDEGSGRSISLNPLKQDDVSCVSIVDIGLELWCEEFGGLNSGCEGRDCIIPRSGTWCN